MKKDFPFGATALALGTMVISGVSVFISKIGVTVINNPIVYTTLKNTMVALLLMGLIIAVKKWAEVKSLTKPQWLKLLAIGVVGGSIPFALFFSGLSKTSAINAALIHKTLFLWVLLLAIPILKERLSKMQWVGVAAIFAANLFVGGFSGFSLNSGELMILLATLLWAAENIIAKIALRDISSILVASARMIFGSVILIAFAIYRGGISEVSAITTSGWLWAILASVLLLGYVLTWYAALKRAPATYVATLLVPATLITNTLSAIFITHAITVKEVTSAGLYLAGLALVIYFAGKGAGYSSAAGKTLKA